VLWLVAAAAHCPAAIFHADFSVTGFAPSNGNAAPTDPVSGTIVWNAADIHSDIQSFVSINLTMDGHTYSVGEIGYFRVASPTTWNGVGGLIPGPGSIWNGYDNFWIEWDSASLAPLSFAYASSQRSGIWDVESIYQPAAFQAFSIAPAEITPAPEPSSAALLIVGSTVLAARWGRRAGGRTGSAA
jgi:hypothetical protein